MGVGTTVPEVGDAKPGPGMGQDARTGPVAGPGSLSSLLRYRSTALERIRRNTNPMTPSVTPTAMANAANA